MKRVLTVVCLAAMSTGLTGCANFFGQFTAHKHLPNEAITRHIDPVNASYDKLGTVEAQGESTMILGWVFQEGTEGYGMMMRNAKAQYGNDVTTILYPMTDYEYQSILGPIYGTITTNYYGTAVVARDSEQDATGWNVDVNNYDEGKGSGPFALLGL
jgi:hypothetical protein